MNKNEIRSRIMELNTDDEIHDFVIQRLNELEENSTEKIVGQNYTDVFRYFISSKVHYKPAGGSTRNFECPDLVYDDVTPYVELIKRIKSGYNDMTLLRDVFFTVYNYLPSNNEIMDRTALYYFSDEKQISIKKIKEERCAFCSEKAGLAHNLFKFLGIDSEVAAGYRDDDEHAYNIVYPNGYNNEPMVLYDPSFFVSLIYENDKISYPFYNALNREKYEELINGKSLKTDLTFTERNCRKLSGVGENYIFEAEEPIYSIGLANDRKKSI